jgi:hypothetical protein
MGFMSTEEQDASWRPTRPIILTGRKLSAALEKRGGERSPMKRSIHMLHQPEIHANASPALLSVA